MGAVSFGIPEDEVGFLVKAMGLKTFVEGGTHKGRTAKKMSALFSKVYTIEKSEAMLAHARETLEGLSNVTLLQGDTREHLAAILEQNDDILFWLDAHWCGGESYGADDECPLIEELGIIFQHNKNAVILIDDARLFVAPPPLPHKIEHWPTLRDIFEATPAGWGGDGVPGCALSVPAGRGAAVSAVPAAAPERSVRRR